MTTAKTQGLGQKKTIHFIELHLLDSIARIFSYPY